MLDKIVIASDKKSAVVHFSTHSVKLSHDVNVVPLVTEMFIEPAARLARSLEDTAIITLPELDEQGNEFSLFERFLKEGA